MLVDLFVHPIAVIVWCVQFEMSNGCSGVKSAWLTKRALLRMVSTGIIALEIGSNHCLKATSWNQPIEKITKKNHLMDVRKSRSS